MAKHVSTFLDWMDDPSMSTQGFNLISVLATKGECKELVENFSRIRNAFKNYHDMMWKSSNGVNMLFQIAEQGTEDNKREVIQITVDFLVCEIGTEGFLFAMLTRMASSSPNIMSEFLNRIEAHGNQEITDNITKIVNSKKEKSESTSTDDEKKQKQKEKIQKAVTILSTITAVHTGQIPSEAKKEQMTQKLEKLKERLEAKKAQKEEEEKNLTEEEKASRRETREARKQRFQSKIAELKEKRAQHQTDASLNPQPELTIEEKKMKLQEFRTKVLELKKQKEQKQQQPQNSDNYETTAKQTSEIRNVVQEFMKTTHNTNQGTHQPPSNAAKLELVKSLLGVVAQHKEENNSQDKSSNE